MWLMLLTVFDNTSLHLFRVLFRNSLVFVNSQKQKHVCVRMCNVYTFKIGTMSPYQNSIDDVIDLFRQRSPSNGSGRN